MTAGHVHGPECEEAAREYHRTRASATLSAFSEEKRDAVLQAAREGIERVRSSFEGYDLSDEVIGLVMAGMGQLLSQTMATPAYALSDTLTDSTAVYLLGSAHLLAGFELPEKSEDLDLTVHWNEFLQGHQEETAVEVSTADDDFRPGNYL